MFQKIRFQLLLSYLIVLAGILTVFAIAIRLVFTHRLIEDVTEEMRILAKSAAATAYFEEDRLIISDELSNNNLVAHDEAVQWFDAQGRLVAQQGEETIKMPLSTKQLVQIQKDQERILAVTLPVTGDTVQNIRYVRASESLQSLDDTIDQLDWGLGIGIGVALLLSGAGGIWLTRQAMKPVEESFNRLKQFTADAAHELRSPIMAVKSNAAVALKYAEGMRSTDAEKFEAISSASEQMARLTENLLLLARADQFVANKQTTVDLTDLLNHLVTLHQVQAEAKQISLTTQLSENLWVLGDLAQLNRVFANLIENAIYYTPSGGTITIQTNHGYRYIWVNVQDTGVGIAPENLERVFDRFWRADQSRSYWAGGAGLGLAIAQAIVQRHHGTITVKSQLGVGSCFTVQLPALQI